MGYGVRRAVAVVASAAVLGLVPAAPGAAGPPAGREAAAVPGLPAGTASVIGYQCGSGVCLIDPDAAKPTPVQVVADGRFAGVTGDGSRMAWVQPGVGLVIAPTTGGEPVAVYDKFVGNAAVISPDGAYVLWDYGVPVMGYTYTMRLTVATGEVTGVSAFAGVPTFGWAGARAIAAYPTSGTLPSRVCWIGTKEETGTDASCAETYVSDPTAGIGFPDGTADQQTFVASANPVNSGTGTVDGPLRLYSRAGGAPVQLTTGATDVTPTLSPDATRVAFEREGQITLVDVATKATTTLTPGVFPSWGGRPGSTPPPPGPAGAVKVRGKVAKVVKQRVRLRLACTGETRCTGKAQVRVGRVVVARGRYGVAAGRTSAVRLRLSARGAKLLRKRATVKAKVLLRPAAGGTVRAKVTLRR